MSRAIVAVLCLVCAPALAGAAGLDPEVSTPYRLQVVLHIAQHRQFTDVYRGQIERELRDSLQAAFGEFAEVEVVHTHPRLAKIEAEGLQQGLDGWNDVTGIKTHFVLIDFADDQYEIQARQHDGLTGLPSPVVRRLQIDDRQLVARAATLLVDRDFGVVGTLTKKIDGQTMEVTLKGGQLKPDLGRWVKPGDVFAIAGIGQVKRKPAGFHVPWALFQVAEESHHGVCKCKLLNRYEDPLREGVVRGYRCLKLGTTRGPLQLRLVDEATRAPAKAGTQVAISRFSFKEVAGVEERVTDKNGLVQTARDYQNVAFVRVVRARIRIPVPILDDRIVECRVAEKPEDETFAGLEVRKERWVKHLLERMQVLSDLAKELSELESKALFAAARDRALPNLKDLEAEMVGFQEEHDELREAARKLGAEGRLGLKEGEQLLHTLQAQREKLATHITDLQNALKEQSDPRKQELEGFLSQAKLLEGQAEYGQALEKYNEAFTKYAEFLAKSDQKKTQELKTHVADLKKAWEPKTEPLRKARDFIYVKWPTLKTAKEMKEHIDKAQEAFQACKAASNTLYPRKLYKETVTHINQLEQELAGLRDANDEDSQKKAETIAKVAKDLEKLLQDITQFMPPPPKAK
jgi:hypothetical protein